MYILFVNTRPNAFVHQPHVCVRVFVFAFVCVFVFSCLFSCLCLCVRCVCMYVV